MSTNEILPDKRDSASLTHLFFICKNSVFDSKSKNEVPYPISLQMKAFGQFIRQEHT